MEMDGCPMDWLKRREHTDSWSSAWYGGGTARAGHAAIVLNEVAKSRRVGDREACHWEVHRNSAPMRGSDDRMGKAAAADAR